MLKLKDILYQAGVVTQLPVLKQDYSFLVGAIMTDLLKVN